MFLFVWSIYLLDRVIDVSRCSDWQQATGRLRFGRRHLPLFFACSSLSILGIAALVSAGLPTDLIFRAALVGVGLVVHFFVFVVPLLSREKLPGKEFGVGLFFALGVYACLGYAEGMLPLLISVAVLIAFNCLVIAAKDAESDRVNDPGGASHWWGTMKRDLGWVGAGLTLVFGLAVVLTPHPAFYLSIAASLLCLTALHIYAQRFSGDAVRAMADFALFTPLPAEAVLAACQAWR